MARKKKDPNLLVIALSSTIGLMVLSLVGTGFWWLGQTTSGMRQSVGRSANSARSPMASVRSSRGEKLLITTEATSAKQEGIKAFGQKNYSGAIAALETSLKQQRNDPETLIYLNNAKAASFQTIEIGVSVPIGSNPNVAQEILRGVAQAQDQVNQAGGINGLRLMITIADDANDAEISKQIATEFVQSNVIAVVGHNASNASLAAAPVYQAGELVMVSPTSFGNGLSGFGNYIFRSVPAIKAIAEPFAQYVLTTARKTRVVACVDSQSPDNRSFRDEFMAAFTARGGQLLDIQCDFSDPTLNPTTLITRAISSGADSLLLTPHIDRIDRAIAIMQANKGRLSLLSSPTLYTIQTIKSGQETTNGLLLPIPWHSSISTGTFVAQAQQYWGGSVSWRTATAYDATQAIIRGLQTTSTRQGLMQTLRLSDFTATGSAGNIQFSVMGDRILMPVIVEVKPGGSAGYDFVAVSSGN